MVDVAVVLSGCGHMDGSEIRESVITLLALDRNGADVTCFAPDLEQRDVINHITGEPSIESRNILVESARIARGKIYDLREANAKNFDALILPGGFGAAKNLSDLAIKGGNATALEEFKSFVESFIAAKKPIGAICISPAVLTCAISDKVKCTVTLGKDTDNLIDTLGGIHKDCPTNGIVVDDKNKIVSSPAYMQDAKLSDVADGIEKLVTKVIELIKK